MARISNLDFYAILGVHPNAEDIVIRAAFKALAQRYHPDRFAGSVDEAHQRMADITNAYETLSDPARRRVYDRRRGLHGRTAKFYFKNPARERPQPFGALAARAAAAKARRYRAAVYVLMVAVVILSAFNIHQHAPQLREFFAGGRATSAVAIDASTRGATVISVPAAPDGSPTGAPVSATNVRVLPITGGTRPIGTNTVDVQTQAPAPAPYVAVPAPSPEPQAPTAAITIPAQPAAREPGKATASTAPPAPEPAHKEATKSPAKPAAAKAIPPDRPTAPPAKAAATQACSDEVLALGLCSRN